MVVHSYVAPASPRRIRAVGVLVAAVALVAASYAVQGGADDGVRDRGRPARAAVLAVPGTVGAAGDRLPVADRIAFWAKRVAEQPSDVLSLTQLAAAHLDQARVSADVSAYERARAAVDAALGVSPREVGAIRVRAAIAFASHDFAAAMADADAVLDRLPADPAALSTRADALLEIGRLDEAEATYEQLRAVAAGAALEIRLARLAYVRGDAERAVARAGAALALASAEGDGEVIGFYHYALGEYARLAGDAGTARRQFAAALDVRPDDLAALVGLARIEAFEGRDEAALARFRDAAAIAPQPETMALLGDLLATLGDSAAAAEAHDTVRLTARIGDLAGAVYDRQLLLFELDHDGATDALLDRARAALAGRADAYGHDLVAWAAYRRGRLDEATAAIARARAHGIRDARVLFHAGAIALAAGDRAEGGSLLAEALTLGPALDPLERAEAVRLLGG